MSRKYRQKGYMNEQEQEKKAPPPKPSGPKEFRPRAMPGFREATRCSNCGTSVLVAIVEDSQCPKCQSDLHTCKHCTFFDTSVRNECLQAIPERISKKNHRNECGFFEPKRTFERETGSGSAEKSPRVVPAGPKNVQDARQAFDALFKK
jgi:hypothetical protein